MTLGSIVDDHPYAFMSALRREPFVVQPRSCDLFVFLKRRAPAGVILRRGPREWTQLILWDTHRDVFTPGQWFRGTVYPLRGDLSPGGDRFLYFVAKHHQQKVDAAYTRTWTAISKPPYWTAVALWPNGGTTYHGGGLFEADDHVLINSVDNRFSNPERGEPPRVHSQHTPPPRVRVSSIAFTSGDQLFVKRLVRDGWHLTSGRSVDEDSLAPSGHFTREVRGFRLELDFSYQKMELRLFRKSKTGWTEHPFDGVRWADFDQTGRLVFARDGQIFAATNPQRTEELQIKALASFTASKPGRLVAPPHATTW